MKSTYFWMKAIAIDAAMAALAYMWLVLGIENAASLLGFVIWVTAISGIVAGLLVDKTMFPRRPKGFGVYHTVTEIAVIAGAAWLGHYVLATAYLLGSLFASVGRKREPKPTKEPA